MTALQQSLTGAPKAASAKPKKTAKATGQREMLLPISGKKAPANNDPKASKPYSLR